jgi:hypothetical protein
MKSDKENKGLVVNKAGIVRARLRAIVAVDEKDRVQCQQPGCGHSVYAAVHVVEEDGHLLVLGSTCFAKRYGAPQALGQAQYGEGGGRKLTEEERLMLLQNTEMLLAHFEAQALTEAKAAALEIKQTQAQELQRKQLIFDKSQRLRPTNEVHQPARGNSTASPGLASRTAFPWPWQKEHSSVALFTSPGGAHWVRVQHRDGSQKLVPWPQFHGWENALPDGIGVPDTAIGAISVDSIIETIRVLQQNQFQGPVIGRWQDVQPGRLRP